VNGEEEDFRTAEGRLHIRSCVIDARKFAKIVRSRQHVEQGYFQGKARISVALRSNTTNINRVSVVHLHEILVLVWIAEMFTEAKDKEARKGYSTIAPLIEFFGVLDKVEYHYRVKVDVHVPVNDPTDSDEEDDNHVRWTEKPALTGRDLLLYKQDFPARNSSHDYRLRMFTAEKLEDTNDHTFIERATTLSQRGYLSTRITGKIKHPEGDQEPDLTFKQKLTIRAAYIDLINASEDGDAEIPEILAAAGVLENG